MHADNLKPAGIRPDQGRGERDGKDSLLNMPLVVSSSNGNINKKYIDKRYIV